LERTPLPAPLAAKGPLFSFFLGNSPFFPFRSTSPPPSDEEDLFSPPHPASREGVFFPPPPFVRNPFIPSPLSGSFARLVEASQERSHAFFFLSFSFFLWFFPAVSQIKGASFLFSPPPDNPPFFHFFYFSSTKVLFSPCDGWLKKVWTHKAFFFFFFPFFVGRVRVSFPFFGLISSRKPSTPLSPPQVTGLTHWLLFPDPPPSLHWAILHPLIPLPLFIFGGLQRFPLR